MQSKLMKKTMVLCSAFVTVAMAVMLYFCANRVVVVADVAQDEVVQAAEADADTTVPVDGNRIGIDRNSENTNYFCIPIPSDVRVEEVTIEDH